MSALISPEYPLDVYFLVVMAFTGTLGGFCLWNQRKLWQRVDSWALLAVPAGALVRWFPIDLYGIWFDEDFQFTSAAFFGPVGPSVHQQQMPLDYFFSALSHTLFGFQEFAPRFFPLVFGSLACGLFYVWARRFLNSKLLLLVATCFFVTSPWLVKYSVEGRPISLAVFSGLIFVMIVGDAFKRNESIKPAHVCHLFLATFLLLGSTFFQNYLFFLAVNITYFLICRPSAKKLMMLAVPQLMALAVWAPFLWVLLSYSVPKYSYSFEAGDLFNLSERLLPIWSIFESTWSSQALPLAIAAPLALFSLLFVIRQRKDFHPGFLESLVLCMTFFTLFSLSFFFLVKWLPYTRYSLMIAPAIILFIFVTLEQTMTLFEMRWKELFLVTLTVALLGMNAHGLSRFFLGDSKYIKSTEWRELYQSVNSISSSGDLILGAPYDNYDSWRMAGPFAHHFYLPPTKKILIQGMNDEVNSNQILFLRELLSSSTSYQPKNVFLIHIQNSGYQSTEVPEDVVFEKYFELGLLHAKVEEKSWPEAVLRLLQVSMDMKDNGENLTFLQLEMEIHIHLKQREKAWAILSRLDSYDMKNKEPELYEYYLSFVNENP